MAAGDGPGTLEPVSGQWSARVRRELAATDWSATPVVDVVTFDPATTLGFEDGHRRTELYRYREAAPPVTTYENGERRYRVERVTRPVYERVTDAGDECDD